MTLDRRSFLLRSGAGVAAAVAGGTAWKSTDGSAHPGSPRPTDDWDAIRDQFNLTREYIHLAGLLLASHATPVSEAIERHRRGLDHNPVDYLHQNERKLEVAVR